MSTFGWRVASAATLLSIGGISRIFLYTLNTVDTQGLESFCSLLDERRRLREAGMPVRGLITVSNHTSVVDDPVMWGVLPWRYLMDREGNRWSLGSHDICFTGRIRGTFFALGNVIPTYRIHKDRRGGLFQPAMTTAVDLMRTGKWLHIFPEGRVHQHHLYQSRYFKWGISRLILEPDEAPMVLPIFTMGLDQVMHESRGFPRFLPRIGKKVTTIFGEVVPDERWADLRDKWQALCSEVGYTGIGDMPEELKNGARARELRIETTWRVRQEVLKLRRAAGWPDEEDDAGDPARYKELYDYEGKVEEGTWEKDM